jgi:glycosyltransferase involved in cell wall biosynthesis
MRILIVSPELPYPPAWGFSIRVSQVLSLLAQRHSVTLLTYAKPGDGANVDALARMCNAVHTVLTGDALSNRKRRAQLMSLFSRRSFQGRYLYSNAMQRKLDELCAGPAFDIIQVESSQMMTFSFDPRSAVVVVEHDIVYELLNRIAMAERSFLRRVYNSAEARKYKREEIDRWNKAAAVVVTSMREVPIVRGAGVTSPILTAANGVDVEYFAPADVAHDPDTLVMTGLMRTRPNIDYKDLHRRWRPAGRGDTPCRRQCHRDGWRARRTALREQRCRRRRPAAHGWRHPAEGARRAGDEEADGLDVPGL